MSGLLHRSLSLRVSLVILFVASRRIRGITVRPALARLPAGGPRARGWLFLCCGNPTLRTQYAWFRSRFNEEPERDEKSRHRDQRVRDTPIRERRRPGNTASRASRTRAGRLLPGPPHRAQGDHRHLLHRAGPRAGRDPLLPLRQRGRGPRRRAPAVRRHGVQERPGRPGPRRRQGGHHRRPGPGQDRTAAARLRPLRRLPRRALRHRLRRRYTQRGHGHHRQGMPLDDRPDDR